MKKSIKAILAKKGYKIAKINGEHPEQKSVRLRDEDFNSEIEVADDVVEEDPIVYTSIEEINEFCGDKDKDHIWAFCSGHSSMDFRGNPKYLFIYINKYRPDIAAYWLCENEDTNKQVRALGYKAISLKDDFSGYIIGRTGVLAAEVVKSYIPAGLENAKFLNLWHGVGFKRSERKQFQGDISMALAEKYIRRNYYYRDNQLFLITSPEFEDEFKYDFGIDKDQWIRAGYPRCEYQQYFEPVASFPHDLIGIKGLPKGTKLAAYAPTFRKKITSTSFFEDAFPEIDRLYSVCQEKGILLIFKVHPFLENTPAYIRTKQRYGDMPYFWFWDNNDDFYEIMGQIDLAIVDYSSIVSDMVAMGVRHYIRYVYDIDEYLEDDEFSQGLGAYKNKTLGSLCYDFGELIDALQNYERVDLSEEIETLKHSLWKHAKGREDFDNIINRTLEFKVKRRDFPTLYSFDVFDTLFSRDVLEPRGIFYYVKEKMEEMGGYPMSLTASYPSIRHTCEMNVRELYRKTAEERAPGQVEIQFDEIFDRMQSLYGLSPEQVENIKAWELEAEYNSVIPLYEQIDLVKSLATAGNTVILISDMYLPEEFVSKLLLKADPFLGTLPLFVSSKYGVQKTSRRLFFEAYKSFEPFYDFGKWVHYGDNKNADETQPRKFGIKTKKIKRPGFNGIQNGLVQSVGTYDAFKVAALQARMRAENIYERDDFVISFVSLCMVPYVDWAVRDAVEKGYETLYFISRDGHPLKRIADAIIDSDNLPIKTKYIYGSRRAWRIPSFIDSVDEDFFSPRHGNFVSIQSAEKLLRAMDISVDDFNRIFPDINLDEVDFEVTAEVNALVSIIKQSNEYNEYLLSVASEKRSVVEKYIRQEIDPTERFAFVEYWGRGYTQDNFRNLWDHTFACEAEIAFYYCRTILPTRGKSIRYNFTSNDSSFFFMEGIFANIPYKSVEGYVELNGRINPIIEDIEYDKPLFDSMQRLLPEFAKKYTQLRIKDRIQLDRMLFEFALNYYKNNRGNVNFAKQIGTLVDSVTLFGDKREFAPPFTEKTLSLLHDKAITRGSMGLTSSITMSYVRTDEENKIKYREMYQIMPGENVAGGRLLSDMEMAENKLYAGKLNDSLASAMDFAKRYDNAVEVTDVDYKCIVIMSKGKDIKNRGLELVEKELVARGMKVIVICTALKEYKKTKLAEMLARAHFILFDNPLELLCKTIFRRETKAILMPENAFRLFNRGFKEVASLKNVQAYRRMVSANDISGLQIPSEFQRKELYQFYTRQQLNHEVPKGCNITDIYYKGADKSLVRGKVEAAFPSAEGKKIILYIPTIRFKDGKMTWAFLLDLERLAKLVGDEYVVIVNLSKADRNVIIDNPIEVDNFSKSLNEGFATRELLVAADVIVGDYRDVFFEAAMLKKPIFSTATDYETYVNRANITENAKNFEQYMFCPIISTADELASMINNIEAYDYKKVEDFKNNVFEYCDGQSVSRMVDYICQSIGETLGC